MPKKRKFKEIILLFIAPYLAEIIVRLTYLTMKIENLHEERARRFWDADERMILAVWHGRLLMVPIGYKGRMIKCLISHHKDGEMLVRFMRRFGHGTVRGSSSRGGAMAMREMLREIKTVDIAVTPDGPRGPKFIVQDGIIALARMTGVPIVPVTFGASRKKIFASWDAFEMPYPFSRGAFLWGEPIYIGKKDDLAEKRAELESRLVNMTAQVDSYLSPASDKADHSSARPGS
ncbi:MAG: lysophospholipid acyltransferase family protein [bacterium]|nr:lysophospholipid acyltransferase family protein [bacterium]